MTGAVQIAGGDKQFRGDLKDKRVKASGSFVLWLCCAWEVHVLLECVGNGSVSMIRSKAMWFLPKECQ